MSNQQKPSSRMKVGETQIAIHWNMGEDYKYFSYAIPYLYNDVDPVDLQLIPLQVTEEHPAHWDQDPEKKKDRMGYVLKDDQGRTWTNGYPTYSASQTSVADYYTRTIPNKEDGSSPDYGAAMQIEYRDPMIVEDLTRCLDRIQTGLDSDKVPEDLKKKLQVLKDRIVTRFQEQFPELEFAQVPILPDVSKVTVFTIRPKKK